MSRYALYHMCVHTNMKHIHETYKHSDISLFTKKIKNQSIDSIY